MLRIRASRYPILLVFLVINACGAEGDGPPAPEKTPEPAPPVASAPDPDPAPDAPDTLPATPTPDAECVVEGFPCTYAEVDPVVLEAALRLGVRAERHLDSLSTFEVAEWIRRDSSVVAVQNDSLRIRYRTRDGRPLWVARDVPDGTRGHPHLSEEHAARSPGAAPAPRSARSLATSISPETNGKNALKRDGIRPYKRAIILSPFRWEFTEDETRDLNAWLTDPSTGSAAVRHYREVRYDAIDTPPDTTFQPGLLNAFRNWDQYDLIHIATHGAQICEDGGCHTVLYTGALIDPMPLLPQGPPVWLDPGVEWVLVNMNECSVLESSDPEWDRWDCDTGRWWQTVTPEFFASRHGPLENTVIYLSACETLKGPDLRNVLAGDGSTMFGFTVAIGGNPAALIARDFYREYLFNGYTAQRAFARSSTSSTNSELARFPVPPGLSRSPMKPPEQGEMVRAAYHGLRGREVVALLEPVTGVQLEDGVVFAHAVGAPDDGIPDSISVTAEVSGIDSTQSHLRFPVEVQVDGAPPVSAELDTRTGDGVWEVAVTAPLGFDYSLNDRFDVEIRADLEEGGTSRWRYEELRLGGCDWWGEVVEPSGAVQRVMGSGSLFYDGPDRWRVSLGGEMMSSDVPDSQVSFRLLRQRGGNPRGLGVPYHIDMNYPGTRAAVTNESVLKVEGGIALGYEWVGDVRVDPVTGADGILGATGTFSATLVDRAHRHRPADLSGGGDVRFPEFEYRVRGSFVMTGPRCVE